jgi:uncharacterized protein (TIGR03067 family)
MKAALLTLTIAVGLVTGAAAQEKDKKEDKAAKLAKVIDELAQVAADNLGVKPLTKEQKKATEPLQGTWAVSKVSHSSKPVPDAELKKWGVTVKGQVFAITEDGEAKPGGVSFLKWIDATKTPKELDLDWIVDDHARPTLSGIYKVEGKTLTIALGLEPDPAKNDEMGTKRAASFKEGDNILLVVLQKVE